MKQLSVLGLVLSFLMTALPAQAVSLTNYNSYLKRWDVLCNNGFFLGFLSVDSDGYYSSSGAGVSKNRDEVISNMLRQSSNSSCS
jgi:hypothetical protein